MKNKYYLVTIQNIFGSNIKKDIIAEEIDGNLYDILLGYKIYLLNKNNFKNKLNDYLYFNKNDFINNNYDLIGIIFSEVSKIYVINYFKDMSKDILKIINNIKNSINDSFNDKTFVKK